MQDTLIAGSHLKQRYNVHSVTVYRWEKQPDFPKVAAVINGRRFYRLKDIEVWERKDAP